MKNVMKKAWEIAYEGVNKFGGKVKEYFAEALKLAWSLLKKGEKITMDKATIFTEKLEQYIDLANECKKYKSETKVPDKENVMNDFLKGDADVFIKSVTTKIEQAKQYLQQLKETVIRTNRFEKMDYLITLNKRQRVAKEVKADEEGYFVINHAGFFEVVENGVTKYIQTTGRNLSMRELSLEDVLRLKP